MENALLIKKDDLKTLVFGSSFSHNQARDVIFDLVLSNWLRVERDKFTFVVQAMGKENLSPKVNKKIVVKIGAISESNQGPHANQKHICL